MALLLVYHKIAEQREFGANVVHPAIFEEQMRTLYELGYRALRVSDAIDESRDRRVAIMFDDAYENVHAYAFPILCGFGFVATIGVITDFVGRANTWDVGIGKAFAHMNWSHISDLRSSGWEIASHTCTHQCLPVISNEEATVEVTKSKITLEDKLGIPIDHMIYPYGRTNARVIKIVETCGYTGASGFFGTGRYNAGRTPIYGFDNNEVFLDKLRGSVPELWKTRIVTLMATGSILMQFLKERSHGGSH